MPPGFSAAQIQDLFAKTANIYVRVPGLIRKYFGHSDDRLSVVGIYLWESQAKTEWQVPQAVESVEGRVVTTPAATQAA